MLASKTYNTSTEAEKSELLVVVFDFTKICPAKKFKTKSAGSAKKITRDIRKKIK